MLHNGKNCDFLMKIGPKNVLFSRSAKTVLRRGCEGTGSVCVCVGGGGLKLVGRDTANNFFMDGLMVLRCGLKFRHSV